MAAVLKRLKERRSFSSAQERVKPMDLLKVFATGAALALLPVVAISSTIDLEALGYERGSTIADTTGAVDYVAALDFGSFQFPSSLTATSADTSISFAAPNGVDVASGASFGIGLPAELESSPLGASHFGTETGVVQYLFEDVIGSGAYAGVNGADVLFEIQAQGLSFGDLDASWADASIVITQLTDATVTAVPGPASMPLLMGGLLGFGLLRRRNGRS